MSWSIFFVKISKTNDFGFSSSSIYDFSIVCLVIFKNSCSMMHIYTICGVWEFSLSTWWIFLADDNWGRLLLLESSSTLEDFKRIVLEDFRNQMQLGYGIFLICVVCSFFLNCFYIFFLSKILWDYLFLSFSIKLFKNGFNLCLIWLRKG